MSGTRRHSKIEFWKITMAHRGLGYFMIVSELAGIRRAFDYSLPAITRKKTFDGIFC